MIFVRFATNSRSVDVVTVGVRLLGLDLEQFLCDLKLSTCNFIHFGMGFGIWDFGKITFLEASVTFPRVHSTLPQSV